MHLVDTLSKFLSGGSPSGAGTTAPAETSAAGGGGWLSNGLTAFQAYASIAGGIAQSNQLKQQAYVHDINARQEEIAGLQAKNNLTDDLLDTLARQRVALSGSDLSTGINNQIFGTTLKRADQVRSDTMLDASIKARAERLSGRALMVGADNAMWEGFANAAGTLGTAIERRNARG